MDIRVASYARAREYYADILADKGRKVPSSKTLATEATSDTIKDASDLCLIMGPDSTSVMSKIAEDAVLWQRWIIDDIIQTARNTPTVAVVQQETDIISSTDGDAAVTTGTAVAAAISNTTASDRDKGR